jgi:hypothetical protein
MEVLFLNSKIDCGVYQYGVRLYNILKNDSYINYIYKEIESLEEHSIILQSHNTVQIIIYNYHVSTMSWLFYTDKNRLNIRITHEVQPSLSEYRYVNSLFNISVDTDSSSGNEYKIPIPNIFKHFEYKEENIIINTFKNIIENFSSSQASQDIFVINCLNKKRNGIYLEIGASCPSGINHSNTFVLEKIYNWKGLLIEYDISCEESYKKSRPNSQYIINDARKINYREFLDSNNYPLNIDYLQIDLEVNNKSTLDVLNVFDSSIFDKYKFATVTFEHDIYTGDWFNTRNISREIFKKNGYILVFPDVIVYHGNGYGPFEDWYVHPELVDMNFINKIKKEQSLFHEDIRKIILNI